MGRIVRFGTVLALGGALALVASGCGSTASNPKSLAVKTVSSYVKLQVAGGVGDFSAHRDGNGEWAVTFSGRFTLSGPESADFAAYCKAHKGQKAAATIYSRGRQMVSANGRKRVGQMMVDSTGQTEPVTCRAS